MAAAAAAAGVAAAADVQQLLGDFVERLRSSGAARGWPGARRCRPALHATAAAL
jgi:hypothetical protein